MNLKSNLLATALAVSCGALALAAPSANAADNGTITFNGQVVTNTCNVNGGTSSFAVTLPNVQTSALTSNGVGAYGASATAFTLNLTGCPVYATAIKVGAQFYSATNADATVLGGLKNTTGTGYATGVDVQLLDNTNTAFTIGTAAPTGNANVTDQVAVSNTGTATLNYKAQYYVANAAPTAGTVSTSVQYVINYQ
jgi:major type 1 subunit fimbrin (pilin)